MKITKIEICNIASIAGEQTIDFEAEPLRSAPLFAITGDTGAGKSTLLDAICLAFYNKTPRCEEGERKLNGRELTPADTRNLLRRGTTEGWSRVTFKAQDGATYCAEWSLRRRRTGTYCPVERQLRRVAPRSQTFDPRNIDADIHRLVGLDYSQFTRTVVLAQNSFANFLKAKNDEKSALLESLTGTEVYSRIGQRIYRLAQDAERDYDLQESRIAGVNLQRLDEADLKKATDEQQLLATRLAAARDNLAATERRLAWMDRYATALEQQNTAQQEANRARRAQLEMGEQQRLLERYDLLLPMQPLYREIKRTLADLDAYRAESKTVEHSMATDRQEAEDARATCEAAQNRLAEVRNQLRQAAPQLKQGYELEAVMGRMADDLAHRTDEGRTLSMQLDTRRKELAEQQNQVQTVRQNIEACERRAQTYAGHQRMIEHADALVEKLSRMVEAAAELNRLKKQTERDQKELAVQSDVQATIEQQCAGIEEQMSSLREALYSHRQANYGRDGEALQQRVVQLSADLERLENAASLWQRLSEGYQRLDALTQETDRLTATNRTELAELKSAETHAAQLQDDFNTLQRSYTLSRSKDVIKLRAELREGVPCPVCGASHHPLHTEAEQAEVPGNNMAQSEAEYQELKAKLAAAKERRDALRQATTARTATLQARLAALTDARNAQQQAEEEWKKYATLSPNFAECSMGINYEGRRVMISQLTDNTRKDLDRARRTWDDFNTHQKQINELTAGIEALQRQKSETEARLVSVKQTIVGIDTRLESCMANVGRYNDLAQALYRELDEAITLQSWWTNMNENPENLRQKLMNMKRDYEDNRQRLLDARQTLQLAEQALANQTQVVDELQARERRNNEERQRMSETMEQQKAQLQSLFGGKSPKEAEEQLQRRQSEAEAECQARRQALQQVEQRLTTNAGRRHNLDDMSRKSQARLSDLRSQLDALILAFNHDHSATQYAEIERVLSDGRNWNALRATLQQRANAALLAGERAQAATRTVDELLKSPDCCTDGTERADCAQAAEQARALIAQISEQLSAVSHRLQSHHDAVSRAQALGDRLSELGRLRDDWRTLCDLFGSADGRRFRSAAQNFTFTFLVGDANKQLSALTRRYSLRPVPGTLSLEIVDHDMLDQLRPVSSLSGGETFIVSLALALALAGLSSANLDIRSLFIDEGFGNLDNESLELVMDALAALQGAQGRQVGVISHTEQIRSRIRPQIHLVKQPAGGKSIIRIEA